jgi:hypothetical protein
MTELVRSTAQFAAVNWLTQLLAGIIQLDSYLEPFKDALKSRFSKTQKWIKTIDETEGGLEKFSRASIPELIVGQSLTALPGLREVWLQRPAQRRRRVPRVGAECPASIPHWRLQRLEPRRDAHDQERLWCLRSHRARPERPAHDSPRLEDQGAFNTIIAGNRS